MNEYKNYQNDPWDEDGYPTQATLDKIENWDIIENGIDHLLYFIEDIWWMPELGFIREDNKLELHTLGWSGNEDIIESLQKNFFWILCWNNSVRGGHYYFDRLNELKK